MSISEDLELDIGGALAEVDRLERAVADAMDRAAQEASVELAATLADTPLSLTLDLDAAGAAADVEAAVEGVNPELSVGVSAPVDEAAITGEITDAVVAADPPPIEVAVEIDTSAVESDLGDLGGAAGDAGEAAEGLTDSLGAVSGAASLATGDVAGVAATLGAVSARGSAAAAGLLAVAGTAGFFVGQAVEAETAQRRFNNALGEFAGIVEHIDVGGLNVDIEELAISLGSSDDAIRSAVAGLAELGTASGASQAQIAATGEQIIALAARAVALNPALGDVGDVAQQMASSLQRGGRFAAAFNISLTSAEVAARALRDTGKSTAAELTLFERTAAAAAIASEGFGDTIGDTVAEGAAGAELSLRSLKARFEEFAESLGTPLIADALSFLTALEPAAEDLAAAFGDILEAALPLATAALPLLAGGLSAAGTAAQVLAAVLGPIAALLGTDIGAGVLKAAGAFLFMVKVMGAVRTALLAVEAQSLATGAVLGATTAVLGPLGIALGVVAAAVALFGDSHKDAAADVDTFTAALKAEAEGTEGAVNQAAIDKLLAFKGALGDTGAQMVDLLTKAGKLPLLFDAMADGEIDAAEQAAIMQAVFDELSKHAGEFELRQGDVVDILDLLGRELGAATALAEIQGAATDTLAGSHRGLRTSVEDTVEAYDDFVAAEKAALKISDDLADARADAADKIEEANEQLSESLGDVNDKLLDDIRGVDDAIADAMQGIVDSFVSKIPAAAASVATAMDTVSAALQQAIDDQSHLAAEFRTLDDALLEGVNLDAVTAELGRQAEQLRAFFDTVQELARQGLADTAELLLEQGPEAGAALAAALSGGTDEQRAAFEATVDGFETEQERAAQVVRDTAGDLPSVLAAGADAATAAFEDAFHVAPAADAEMGDLRDAVVGGLQRTADEARQEASRVATETVAGINDTLAEKEGDLFAQAREAGLMIADGLVHGILEGINAVDVGAFLEALIPGLDVALGDLLGPGAPPAVPLGPPAPPPGVTLGDLFAPPGSGGVVFQSGAIVIQNPVPEPASETIPREVSATLRLMGPS